jgi:mRNA interferase MazF
MLKGRLVLIPFPFDDLQATKVRPALCLTEPVGPFQHVVLAFITSRIPDPLLESDLVLSCSGNGREQMGLKTDSTLRLHRLMTVTAGLIQRELGRIPPDIQTEIDAKLRALFGL